VPYAAGGQGVIASLMFLSIFLRQVRIEAQHGHKGRNPGYHRPRLKT